MLSFTILIIIFSLFNTQLSVTYYNSKTCSDKSIYDYVSISPPCLNSGSTSTQVTCTQTGKVINTYDNNNCIGSITSTIETIYQPCNNNIGYQVCENNITYSGALVYQYNDINCNAANVDWYLVMPIGICAPSWTFINSYTMYSCSGNVLSQKIYNNSLCSGSPFTNSQISTSNCTFAPSFGKIKLISCNAGFSYIIPPPNNSSRTSRVLSKSSKITTNILLMIIVIMIITSF